MLDTDRICLQRNGMGVELRIVFDGDEPGIAQHRLSLSSFGEPLKLLLTALQRTASAMLASALDDPDYGKRGGKLAADAKLLDLELQSIEGGCVSPTFVCTERPGSQIRFEGFDMLGERAVQRLLQDIDAERQGRLVNASVRKYLASLPSGVRSQRYTASVGGAVLADVQFDEAALVEAPATPAGLVKLRGRIVGVGFEPGASFVAIKTERRTVRCAASGEQVERALTLRHCEVVAAVLHGQGPVLVWVRDAAEHVARVPIEATIEHLHTTWSETLEILAR